MVWRPDSAEVNRSTLSDKLIVPCFHTVDLSSLLHLSAFSSLASDLVRQQLSAWLKSSGPAGRAKLWVCFPSERLLFARSGN